MILDLKSVFMNENEKLETTCDIDMSQIEVSGVKPFVSSVKVNATAYNRAGLVQLQCKAEFTYSRPCDRCDADTAKQMSYTFVHPLVVSLSGDHSDDYIETPDFTIDLDSLIKADILLELPAKYLCKEDCKGLCDTCGADLNISQCSCDKSHIDPRLEVLKQLIDNE